MRGYTIFRDISLEIPHNRMTVITGVSGSGKSSLAFDTIYAEGQRPYVESLSTYARQFLGRMEKPEANELDGIAPACDPADKYVAQSAFYRRYIDGRLSGT